MQQSCALWRADGETAKIQSIEKLVLDFFLQSAESRRQAKALSN
jgi:hypothetical protein